MITLVLLTNHIWDVVNEQMGLLHARTRPWLVCGAGHGVTVGNGHQLVVPLSL